MRLTISLEDDLYAAVKSFSAADDVSLSAAVNQLLRRAIFPASPLPVPGLRNGVQVVDSRPVTSAEVRRLEAEE